MKKDMVDRLVENIADELFAVDVGLKGQEMGNRLAVMQGKYPNEKQLGGRNRSSVEEVLRRHLARV
jgi:hypothetical protein